jgi:hypothetical protein
VANTFSKLSTITVASATPTITFSSIPQNYTDLVLYLSIRSSGSDEWTGISFNGLTTNFVIKHIQGNGSSAFYSSVANNLYFSNQNPSSYTANAFASGTFVIPNYSGSTNKSFTGESVQENAATLSFQQISGGLWSNTAAITSITLTAGANNYVQYSTATLYGIKSS